jgi:hypothetical protein
LQDAGFFTLFFFLEKRLLYLEFKRNTWFSFLPLTETDGGAATLRYAGYLSGGTPLS